MEHIIFKKEQYSLKSISANPVSGFSPKKMLYISVIYNIYNKSDVIYNNPPKLYFSALTKH